MSNNNESDNHPEPNLATGMKFNNYNNDDSSSEVIINDDDDLNMEHVLKTGFGNFNTASTDMMLGHIANNDKLNDDIVDFKKSSPKEEDNDDLKDKLNDFIESVKNSDRFSERPNSNDVGINGVSNNNINNTNNITNNNTGTKNEENEDEALAKLDMLRQLGELRQNYNIKLSQKYNMMSDYKTMKYEYDLHKGIIEKKQTMSWLSSSLVNICWGIEICNNNFDPFGFKLSGWHERVKADQENYVSILGDLYEKYFKSSRSTPPEIKLILTLLGSAISFHIGKNAVNELPDLTDLMAKNPGLKAQLDNIAQGGQGAQGAQGGQGAQGAQGGQGQMGQGQGQVQGQTQAPNNTNDLANKEREIAAQKMRDLEMIRQSRERYNRETHNGQYNDIQSNRSGRSEELMRKLMEKDNHIRSLQDQLDMAKSESRSMYMSRDGPTQSQPPQQQQFEQHNINPPNIPSRYANKFKQPEPVKKTTKKNTKKNAKDNASTSSYDGKPVTNINSIMGDMADSKDNISNDTTSKAESYFSKNRKRRYPIFVDTLLKNAEN